VQCNLFVGEYVFFLVLLFKISDMTHN